MEIFNKSGDVSSESSMFDNETDDVALTDVIINDDSDKEEETCNWT